MISEKHSHGSKSRCLLDHVQMLYYGISSLAPEGVTRLFLTKVNGLEAKKTLEFFLVEILNFFFVVFKK